MEGKEMTIDQVAELAYVSRSVVSRVLNNHPNVSDEARQRVLDVIEEHDFRPSSVARSLATDRSFEISVLSPRRGDDSRDEELANGYWPLLYSGLFEQCLERGYFVSLSIVGPDMREELKDRVRDQRFDGYVLVTQEVTDLVADTLRDREVPTALIGRDPNWTDVNTVDIDNEEGGYKAGAHLCSLGYDDVGLILGSRQLEETSDRRRGFERALEEGGRTLPEERVAEGDYSQESGYNIIQRWCDADALPRALFCASDTIAMGVLLALYERGYQVPDDVAVVGFDGLPASQYTIPPLTTVRQPVYEKGQKAANLLIDQIEAPGSEPVYDELEPELVVRKSCGAV